MHGCVSKAEYFKNNIAMKKFYILLVAMAISVGTVFAQSDDEIQRQQEALLKQQQKEQQDLIRQQQREQEELQKQQAKEEARMQKEQEKARQDEIKKEQDRQKREQTKAENEARKEAKAAEKKAKRAEHYAQWGRKPGFTADPYASALLDRRIYTKNSLYNSVGINLGVTFEYHRPIARRMDVNIGLGYRQSMYYYSHLFAANATITADQLNGDEQHRSFGTIVLPLKMVFVNKDNKHGSYIGVTPGINLQKTYAENAKFNAFRFDLAIGTQTRWLIFAPGTELYFNLVPTYATGDTKIHEIGVRFTL